MICKRRSIGNQAHIGRAHARNIADISHLMPILQHHWSCVTKNNVLVQLARASYQSAITNFIADEPSQIDMLFELLLIGTELTKLLVAGVLRNITAYEPVRFRSWKTITETLASHEGMFRSRLTPLTLLFRMIHTNVGDDTAKVAIRVLRNIAMNDNTHEIIMRAGTIQHMMAVVDGQRGVEVKKLADEVLWILSSNVHNNFYNVRLNDQLIAFEDTM